MAVEGIGTLVQNFAERQFGERPTVQPTTRIVGAHDVGVGAPQDTFTPSSQNSSAPTTAQDAGIFQLPQGTLTAAAGEFLATQTAPGTNPDGFQPQPSSGSAADNGTSEATQPADAIAGQSAAGPAAAAEVQNQIQTLNAALPALGLSNNQIQEIDRIAAQIKDFNPTAYANLVNQFESQSEEAEQAKAASVPGAANGAPSPAVSGGIQVREIFARNIGAPVTATNASTAAPAASANQGSANSGAAQADSVQGAAAGANSLPNPAVQPQQNGTLRTESQPPSQT